jgi:hypothetical protein
MSLTDLKEQALQLTREEQIALRDFIDEIANPVDPAFDQRWLEIVNQRRENVRSGRSQTVPLEDVLRELDDPV